jgi:hypothetical protein
MIKTILLILAVAVTTLIFSCQKEVTAPDIITRTTNNVDSFYIDKIVESDSANATIADTSYYSYDNAKRVVSIIKYYKQGIIGVAPFDKTVYTYNGADTIPAKVEFYSSYTSGTNAVDTFTTYLSFDGSGKRIKDSLLYHSQSNLPYTVLITYSYASNNIFRNVQPIGGSLVTGGNDTVTIDAAGNIIQYNGFANVPATFQYATNINPLSRLSNFKALGANDTWMNIGFFDRLHYNVINSFLEVAPGNDSYNTQNLFYPDGRLNKSITIYSSTSDTVYTTYLYKAL